MPDHQAIADLLQFRLQRCVFVRLGGLGVVLDTGVGGSVLADMHVRQAWPWIQAFGGKAGKQSDDVAVGKLAENYDIVIHKMCLSKNGAGFRLPRLFLCGGGHPCLGGGFRFAQAGVQPEKSPAAIKRFRFVAAALLAGMVTLDFVTVDVAVAPLRVDFAGFAGTLPHEKLACPAAVVAWRIRAFPRRAARFRQS